MFQTDFIGYHLLLSLILLLVIFLGGKDLMANASFNCSQYSQLDNELFWNSMKRVSIIYYFHYYSYLIMIATITYIIS